LEVIAMVKANQDGDPGFPISDKQALRAANMPAECLHKPAAQHSRSHHYVTQLNWPRIILRHKLNTPRKRRVIRGTGYIASFKTFERDEK